uniref:Adenosine deaminase domain-containing protein n=1 Tax=Strombidium rassoulzadegani TaxID=1082188 RepID=A0A7S3FU79_9SPIT|mmetsp:Transcript_18524/g.31706  ORF Transcript_18524/g.31706 Transcript_18524/m.31706 type:complete len:194 (+) Transcript_18524:1088-1669(+)
MVIGFDMVNEEDFTPAIDFFKEQIYEAREKAESLGQNLDVYLHCGETNSRDNMQLYDAIAIGTKRIGHGFHLAYYPELQKIVKEREICIECCPVSNFVLGYVLDPRTHPARSFLHQGLPLTISSDDPGFMSYEGVTLDYVYVYMSWDLDIADLKQLALNTIKYSSVSDDQKPKYYEFFEIKWQKFVDYIIGRY